MYANAQSSFMEETTIAAASKFRLENSIMNKFTRLAAFVPAILLVAVLGCTATATRDSTGEYITDSWITTKVKAALVGDTQVKATEVNVETFRGVVQLSGFVSSATAMNQAVEVANSIEGVVSVENDMRIK
jgi:hyperosmotically inducible protein